MNENKLCPNCLGNLDYEKDESLKEEYTYVCNSCDENFYSFEAINPKDN